MQFSTLLSVAALAWSATSSALLLPPDTTGEALEAFKAPAHGEDHLTFNVQCAGCPVAQDREDDALRVFINSAELNSEIIIEASVNEKNIVTVGGVPVYPASAASAAPIVGKQVLKEGGDGMVQATEEELSLSTRMDIATEKVHEDGHASIQFAMEVLGIEDKVVHVGTITFCILRDADGKLAVINPKVLPTLTTLADAQCTTVLCRVKMQLMAKVAAAKAKTGAFVSSCMRKMGLKSHPHHGAAPHHGSHHNGGHHAPGNVVDRLKGGPNKYAGKFGKKPCPGKNGHRHGHHSSAGKLIHFLAATARNILVPVMIGIAAGMAVSALGMVIGQIIFMIYQRVQARRGVVAVYHVVGAEDVEAAEDDEPLPMYVEKEGLPEYTPEYTPEEKN